MFDAVIFDCDGVLVDSEIIGIAVEIAVLAEFGLTYEERAFKQRFLGMSDRAFYAALDEDGLARLGRSIIAEARPQIQTRKRAAMEALKEVQGASLAVQSWRKRKAVASSSTTAQLEAKMKRTHLWDHFGPHIYSADHVARAKPAPDLFLHAASQLGLPPQACLVIEDSVNGVLAAREAGMRVWGFLGGGHMDERAGERLLLAGAERLVAHWPEFQRLTAEQG